MADAKENENQCSVNGPKCSYSYNPCPSCGVVTSLFGKMEVKRSVSKDWCDVRAGIAVGARDSLRLCGTKDGFGRVRVVYHNAGLFTDFMTNSIIEYGQIRFITGPKAQPEMEIARFEGKVHCAVNVRFAPLKIKFCHLVVNTYGGEFTIECESKQATFRVLQGAINLDTGTGKAVEIGEGMQCTVHENSEARAEEFSDGEQEKWWEGLTTEYPG